MPNLNDWIEALNQRLAAAGASGAERAFSLGCSTSLVPILIVLGIAFLAGARHWVSLLITLMVCLLLATVWTAFVANQATRGSIRHLYQNEIYGEIMTGLAARTLGWTEFVQQAETQLPKDAPLCVCLGQPAPQLDTDLE
jgi:hypothetical protein